MLLRKTRPAPAADESAKRGVSPPRAPPTSPSTVTKTSSPLVLAAPSWFLSRRITPGLLLQLTAIHSVLVPPKPA